MFDIKQKTRAAVMLQKIKGKFPGQKVNVNKMNPTKSKMIKVEIRIKLLRYERSYSVFILNFYILKLASIRNEVHIIIAVVFSTAELQP